LTDHWSIKGEYLYAKFSDEDFEFPDARGGVGNNYANVAGRNACNGADPPHRQVGCELQILILLKGFSAAKSQASKVPVEVASESFNVDAAGWLIGGFLLS
jgi:hypothetical protein